MLPPCNKNARDVSEVDDVYSIVPNDVLRLLNSAADKVIKSEPK